jgi:hypothetical protein
VDAAGDAGYASAVYNERGNEAALINIEAERVKVLR